MMKQPRKPFIVGTDYQLTINTGTLVSYLISSCGNNRYIKKIVNEYDQEIPQSQTADNPVAP